MCDISNCNNCIHKKLCVIRAFPSAFENTHWEKEPCDHFKDESKYVELPCKVGDITYHLISIETYDGLNVAAIHKGKVCSISKDEKTLCIFGRYDNGLRFWCTEKDIGEKLFFVCEEAEQALKGAPHEE